jgi:chemotaxis protein MotA
VSLVTRSPLPPPSLRLAPVFVIVGLIVVIGSVIGGYVMHHGKVGVLWQPTEFIIIGGAGIGAFLVANGVGGLKAALAATMGLLKANPFSHTTYSELLQVLYEVFQRARKDGLVGLEAHIEEPDKSDIFTKFPHFSNHKAGVALLSDTLKVLLTGAVEDHNLSEILEIDLDQQHEANMHVSHAITTVGDAMPGFGIVAAVLGVIITMGSIGGAASEIGEKVAAALVGTFIGILLSYGIIGPIATAIQARVKAEHAYMCCIRTALLSFARGDAPMTAVEFARRNIDPHDRPSFAELEALTRKKAA